MLVLNRISKSVLLLAMVFVLVGLAGCEEEVKVETKKAVAEKPAAKAAEAGGEWVLQFSDDFERAELGDNWKTLEGEWVIKDGALTIGGWGCSEIISAKNFSGMHRMEFDSTSGENACDLTGVICANDDGFYAGYFIGFGSDNNYDSKLLVEGYEEKRWDAVIVPGKVHHQVIERDGKTVRHIVDGKVVMTYEHDEPLTGEDHQKVGFYTCGESSFDNIKIYTKSEK